MTFWLGFLVAHLFWAFVVIAVAVWLGTQEWR